MKSFSISVPLAVLFLASGLHLAAAESTVLKPVNTIVLDGVSGRIDHLALDAKRNRLFVAALGNDTLEILDVAATKRLHTITGLHKPQGVVYLPELNQIVVGDGSDGTCKLFDGRSYQLIKSIDAMDDADNVRYDTQTKLIYQGWGDGALAVIDNSFKRIADIKLDGHPESFQLESAGPRVFVNVPDARQIAVVDRKKGVVTAKWPMKKYQSNFPMALDEAGHRLFVGCRRPSRLVVLDTDSGREVSALPISGDTDDVFYDSAHKRIYVSCGEGFVDVITRHDNDAYEVTAKISTAAGARTSYFSPGRNEYYLAVPARFSHSAEIRIYTTQP